MYSERIVHDNYCVFGASIAGDAPFVSFGAKSVKNKRIEEIAIFQALALFLKAQKWNKDDM